MMTAVFGHMSCVPEYRAYYDKKRVEGMANNKAIRSLGNHMSRVIWSMGPYDRDYIESILAQIKKAA